MNFHPQVFIDTNVFDKNHYNSESREFKIFCEHFRGKPLNLLLPSPIRGELDKHIKSNSVGAVATLNRAQKDNPYILQYGHWVNSRKNRDSLVQELIDKFTSDLDEFLSAHNTIAINLDSIDSNMIMSQYFEQSPPFGEGSKSKEFADAFAMQSLEEHYIDTGNNIHVISADPDLAKYCNQGGKEHFFYFKSIPQFIEYCLIKDREIEDQLEKLLKQQLSILSDAQYFLDTINEVFNEQYFIIEEDLEEGEVEDIEVISMNTVEFDITSIGDDECEVSFTAEVHYTANLDFRDLANASYDSEDGIYFGTGSMSEKVEFSEDEEITGSLKFRFCVDHSCNPPVLTISPPITAMIDGDQISIYATGREDYYQ